MKLSGNMCLKIILKITKKQGFILSLEDIFFKQPQGREGGGGVKLIPPPILRCFRVKTQKICVPFVHK